MKITINTTEKTITVEQDVIVGELVSQLETMLPDWKEYKLMQKAPVIEWQMPTVYPKTNWWDDSPKEKFKEIFTHTEPHRWDKEVMFATRDSTSCDNVRFGLNN